MEIKFVMQLPQHRYWQNVRAILSCKSWGKSILNTVLSGMSAMGLRRTWIASPNMGFVPSTAAISPRSAEALILPQCLYSHTPQNAYSRGALAETLVV